MDNTVTLQSFINDVLGRLRRVNIPTSGTFVAAERWTNLPTPVAFRMPDSYDPAVIRAQVHELWVGLFRYNHIIKRMRKWVRDTVNRMRHVKWAENFYAPPRSIAGGRRGGLGYREAQAEYNYNSSNSRITRLQRRRYSDPYLLDYLRKMPGVTRRYSNR